MGKVSQIITGSLVSVLVLGGSVSALDASITDTGPNSDNSIVGSSGDRCTVSNNNDVNVDNSTDQTAESGDAETSSNTEGGNATSGSASNSNTVDVGVVIDNGSACSPEEAAGPVTPPAGGQGGGQVEGTNTTQPVGGFGAGMQVAAPVGGVGAGSGGSAMATFIASLAAMAYGVLRLKRNAFTDRF